MSNILMVKARVRLDWSDEAHWAEVTAPCRHCDTGTHGRDETGRPAHKSCAEASLAAEVAGQLDGLVVDERARSTYQRTGAVR